MRWWKNQWNIADELDGGGGREGWKAKYWKGALKVLSPGTPRPEVNFKKKVKGLWKGKDLDRKNFN